LLALATQIIVMGFMVAIVAQTDARQQVLAAVAVGGFLGAYASELLFPIRSEWILLLGPMFVAVIGYLMAMFVSAPLDIGQTTIALARPLPLDYASFGTMGVLIAWWMQTPAPAIAGASTVAQAK
jgi:hypothetical protein